MLQPLAAAVMIGGTALAADEAAAPRPFAPGELSIGEPIALPFGRSATGDAAAAPATTPAPADDPRADLQPASAGLAVPGSGWLGLAVAESNVPGRWRVEEVAPWGPAARAGIAVGDELRAVNGVNLASAADVSQALTGIAAGQNVRVAVARAEQVTDVVLRAEPRPAVRPAESSRFTAAPPAKPAAVPAPAAVQPAASAPVQVGPAAASPEITQASSVEWQAATTHDPPPSPPPARFSPAPGTGEPASALPSVVASPATAAPVSRPPHRGSGRTVLGVYTNRIDAAKQDRFHLAQPAGAYVTGVRHDLPAAKAGVPTDCVIVAIGEQPVRSPDELTSIVSSGPLDRPVTVHFVLPGGATQQTAVVLQALDAPLEWAPTVEGTSAVPPPALQPAPRRAERPPIDDAAIRTEFRALRGMLDRLERLLDPASRRRP